MRFNTAASNMRVQLAGYADCNQNGPYELRGLPPQCARPVRMEVIPDDLKHLHNQPNDYKTMKPK